MNSTRTDFLWKKSKSQKVQVSLYITSFVLPRTCSSSFISCRTANSLLISVLHQYIFADISRIRSSFRLSLESISSQTSFLMIQERTHSYFISRCTVVGGALFLFHLVLSRFLLVLQTLRLISFQQFLLSIDLLSHRISYCALKRSFHFELFREYKS